MSDGELARVEADLRTRWPESHLEPSLDRIRALVDLLGAPQAAYPVIHLTGTNGKTSTARMADALLGEFGLRVGRFTSPHLASVTERISLNGEPIAAERFVAAYDEIAPYLELVDSKQPIRLSYFEVLTAIGFVAFAYAPVDVAVVEVGMGGAWDSTNVADGRVAVVTPIALDHVQYLGSTIAAIAGEKAGIIKPGSIAVLAAQPPEAAEPLLRRAAEVDATVAREGLEFGVLRRSVAVGGQQLALQGLGGVYDEVFVPLYGGHQAENAVTALAAVEAFFGAGAQRQLDVEAVREAFASVVLPGRLERVRSAPSVFVDAAHNPHGAAALAVALDSEFGFRRLVAVVGVMGDKDARGILAELEPVVAEVVVTRNTSPRAMDPDELGAVAREVFGEDRIVVEPRLDDAIETAVRLAETGDGAGEQLSGAGVIATGSVVTAGEVRALFGKEPG
jgi:dihydrofolate synthase / folylpolyglutamate synthase